MTHAEIAGAGLCGISTALLLRQAGWSVRVHEQASSVREIGAGIVLHEGACSVFEHLGLIDEIQEQGVLLDGSAALDSDGRVLADRELDGEFRQIALPRQTLMGLLLRAAEALDVEIVTGSKAIAARPDGTLVVDGDKEFHADLVVAADGFHSAVRDSLKLTAKKISRTNGATRALVKWESGESRTVLREYWSTDKRVGVIPVGDGLTYCYLSSPETDRRATAVPIDVAHWSAAFPGVPRELFELLSRADARHDSYAYVKPRAWAKGSVAIVGDALNALPPSLGLGVSLGLRNARLMVDAITSGVDVVTALQQWEAKARPDTEWIQNWSLRRERLAHNLPSPLAYVRSRMISRSNGMRGWSRNGKSFDGALVT
ncbi:MAG: FAD-dependent monooxygenase [Cryobacterium sp.]|nr:FAD-dependent monooxygenase [Cryobacterium sp.]